MRHIRGTIEPDGELNPRREKALLDKSRREAQELENERKRGELVDLQTVLQTVGDAAVMTREHLMGIPGRFAAILWRRKPTPLLSSASWTLKSEQRWNMSVI